ncbi:MAG: dihydroorotase [Methanoregulaceae archaeon]
MGSLYDLVLKNVLLPTGGIVDITIHQGSVVHAGAALPSREVRDCSGFLVLPAAVDMHVHMRGGKSQSAKEDWSTGSRSALAGGVTLVVDQPNTIPPIITPDLFRNRVREAEKESLCQFSINSGICNGTDIPAMWKEGVMAFGEIFYAPSSYGEAIGKDCLREMLRATGELDALATIHAEEPVPGDDIDLPAHDRARPGAGEIHAVRVIGSLRNGNEPIHFCHMSTRESVYSAKPFGTVEVTPHHLFLSRDAFVPDDSRGKVNPPLRSESVRKNLWNAWDSIDVIASDHAPHTLPEKSSGFPDAPSGIPGVETMVPLLLHKVLEGKISLQSVIEKTSHAPCRILRIPEEGYSPGCRADFAIFPKESRKIRAEDLHSRCGWTPYEGMQAVFPREVIMAGQSVFCDGEYTGTPGKWFFGRGYIHPATI